MVIRELYSTKCKCCEREQFDVRQKWRPKFASEMTYLEACEFFFSLRDPRELVDMFESFRVNAL